MMNISYRDTTKVKKKIEVYKDDFEWFLRTHQVDEDSSRTGFPAVINMLLHAYRTVCENPKEHIEELDSLALINIATRAATIVQEEIKERGIASTDGDGDSEGE